MKSRRIAIVALALVTVLTMGIGYAALNDALEVSGEGTLSKSAADGQFDGEVYFTGTPEVTLCTAALEAGEKPDKATITISDTLAIVGDQAIAKFTVKNESAVPVTVTTDTSNDTAHFRVTAESTSINIPANETEELVIKVTLKQTVSQESITETFGIKFNVVSAG
jgi:hypothetical protein